MKVGLECNRYGHYVVSREDRQGYDTLYVQSDWDFPGLARNLGWSLTEAQVQGGLFTCTHPQTDGTVTCPTCGLTASDFIAAAAKWLDDNDGQVFEVDDDVFNFKATEEV